jgi:hypothetical protein
MLAYNSSTLEAEKEESVQGPGSKTVSKNKQKQKQNSVRYWYNTISKYQGLIHKITIS